MATRNPFPWRAALLYSSLCGAASGVLALGMMQMQGSVVHRGIWRAVERSRMDDECRWAMQDAINGTSMLGDCHEDLRLERELNREGCGWE